jgi:hypothetical protein
MMIDLDAATPEQLRDSTKAAWLRIRENPAMREAAMHLSIALHHLTKAAKAAGNTTEATP